MYIPSKKHKFGLKEFCLVDPTNMYLVNCKLYPGKDQMPERNLGENITMELATKFLDEGRTIVADNFFTSSRLGLDLWSRKTYLLGTLRKNRTDNPNDFIKEPFEVGFLE